MWSHRPVPLEVPARQQSLPSSGRRPWWLSQGRCPSMALWPTAPGERIGSSAAAHSAPSLPVRIPAAGAGMPARGQEAGAETGAALGVDAGAAGVPGGLGREAPALKSGGAFDGLPGRATSANA